MAIDPSSFLPNNITDTCAVWNVLSSRILYSAARVSGVVFVCSGFVIYECLYKWRKVATHQDEELKSRLRVARLEPSFASHPLEIEDLQMISLLENRKRMGKGELSSIAFAVKTGQAFLTDDQKARKLVQELNTGFPIQTTPHLFAWLFFIMRLFDSDKDKIITEHAEMGRPLSKYFEEMYSEACRCRLMHSQWKNAK